MKKELTVFVLLFYFVRDWNDFDEKKKASKETTTNQIIIQLSRYKKRRLKNTNWI